MEPTATPPTPLAPAHRLIVLVASAGYVGYIPVASGTFGTLVGIPLFWAFAGAARACPGTAVAVFALATLASCWIAGRADELLGEHDSHKIVIDEVLGFLAATLFLEPTWTTILLAFFVFRALDVIKPFPAGYVDEKFPGGWGVVLDDVVSGFYTRLVLLILGFFLPL